MDNYESKRKVDEAASDRSSHVAASGMLSVEEQNDASAALVELPEVADKQLSGDGLGNDKVPC